LADLKSDLLASGLEDSTINIWNWRRGLSERNLTGHQNKITDLCSSSLMNNQSALLISTSLDRTIRFWHVSSGHEVRSLEIYGRKNYLIYIALLNNDRYLASSGSNSAIQLWNVTSGLEKAILIGHKDHVESFLALDEEESSPPLLASGSQDAKIIIWDSERQQRVETISGHSGSVIALKMLPTGHLASASHDGLVRVWNLRKTANQTILTLNMTFVTNYEVACLAVLSDGNLAIALKWADIQIRHFSKHSNFSSMRFSSFFSNSFKYFIFILSHIYFKLNARKEN
jgi:WD40 repeat protein